MEKQETGKNSEFPKDMRKEFPTKMKFMDKQLHLCKIVVNITQYHLVNSKSTHHTILYQTGSKSTNL
jgi:hypothetical protein